MKEKPKILAKPSGISLGEHTQHVTEEASYILRRLPFLAEKYSHLCHADLQKELKLAARYHDWGKSDPRWQKPCQEDYQGYQQWRKIHGLAPEILSAKEYRQFEVSMFEKGNMPAPKLFKAGLRHELASIELIAKNNIQLSLVVKAAIGAHHGKMGFRGKKRWFEDGKILTENEGPFAKYWKEFERLSFQGSQLPMKESLIERFKYSAIRSLLQLADTRASRKEGEGEDAAYELSPFSMSNKYTVLRPVQQAVLGIAQHPISILRAPTGSGKTYAALLWAEQQVKQGRADRLVIAMPTRFTSNALSISTAEQLGETGLYHSSAWYNRYGEIKEKEALKDAREAHRMARYLATPITVCTIDHLLICLTGTREAHHSTFYFLANSAVVLDEADFYDPFIQANIVILIKVLRYLKVPILIMSATVPDSARTLYQVEVPIIAPLVEDNNTIKKLQLIDSDWSACENVLRQMVEEGHGIIYANTIRRALEYYKWFMHNLKDDTCPIVLYHSQYTEADKKRIEEELIAWLGKTAWENHDSKPVRGIAIMTQIGEMSVNISSPIMLSDLCPWDRLAQRMGRLIRFGFQKTGTCYVTPTLREGKLYPAPYGEYDKVNRRWIAFPALLETEKELNTRFRQAKEVNSQDFVDYVNDLYPVIQSFDDHTVSNQQEYQQLIRNNWLILPDMYTNEDEGHVGSTWSSRHIPPQQTIYTEPPHSCTSYADLQSFGLEYGISIPIYLLKKELRKKERSLIQTIEIDLIKEDEKISVYYTLDYDSKLGLSFLYDSDFKSNVEKQNL